MFSDPQTHVISLKIRLVSYGFVIILQWMPLRWSRPSFSNRIKDAQANWFEWLLSERMKMKMVFVSLTLIMKLFFRRPGPSSIDFIQENESGVFKVSRFRHDRGGSRRIQIFHTRSGHFRLLFILYDYLKGVCFGMSGFSTSYCDELLRERNV